MVEKRFTMNVGISNFTDNQTQKMYSEYNLDEVVDLLNEQSEKLSEQSVQIDFLKSENQHMKSILEENKLLKRMLRKELQHSGNKHFVEILDDEIISIDGLKFKRCINND